MRGGGSVRLGRGVSVYYGGGGGVAFVVWLALMGGLIRLGVFLLIGAIVLVILILKGINTATPDDSGKLNRLAELAKSSIPPTSLPIDGQFTTPRTWGVFMVERLIKGQRRYGFYFGNYPVHQRELVRKYGEANLVALFTSRIDAEECAYLLNENRERVQIRTMPTAT